MITCASPTCSAAVSVEPADTDRAYMVAIGLGWEENPEGELECGRCVRLWP